MRKYGGFTGPYFPVFMTTSQNLWSLILTRVIHKESFVPIEMKTLKGFWWTQNILQKPSFYTAMKYFFKQDFSAYKLNGSWYNLQTLSIWTTYHQTVHLLGNSMQQMNVHYGLQLSRSILDKLIRLKQKLK